MVRAGLLATDDEIRPDLKAANVGPAVREAQATLKTSGHNPGEVDAKFGAMT